MNKHYLNSLASYQTFNMSFYVILSAIVGNPITLSGAVICFALGVIIHKYFGYMGQK